MAHSYIHHPINPWQRKPAFGAGLTKISEVDADSPLFILIYQDQDNTSLMKLA